MAAASRTLWTSGRLAGRADPKIALARRPQIGRFSDSELTRKVNIPIRARAIARRCTSIHLRKAVEMVKFQHSGEVRAEAASGLITQCNQGKHDG